MGDRGKAVVNVLRHNPDQRAIVFGTTREGVADLHRELVGQGFRAVVLSGDRAQAERNRALEALRAGEAQILVATNVAARGLDLPEVDLVRATPIFHSMVRRSPTAAAAPDGPVAKAPAFSSPLWPNGARLNACWPMPRWSSRGPTCLAPRRSGPG